MARSACPDGTDDPAETRRLTRRYLTAFFEWKLLGLEGGRAWLTGAGIQADVAAGLVLVQSKNNF